MSSNMKNMFGFMQTSQEEAKPNNKSQSLFGNMFSSNSMLPKAQSNQSLNTKENLRSLMITFNHSNKTEEDKLRNIDTILDKVIGYGTHIAESQLEFKGFIQITLKAMVFYSNISPVDVTIIQLCINSILVLLSSNNEMIIVTLDQAKTLSKCVAIICELAESKEIDPSIGTNFAHVIKGLIKKNTKDELNVKDLFDVLTGETDVLWKVHVISILKYFVKSKRFTSEQIQLLETSGQFNTLVHLLTESSETKQIYLSSLYLELIVDILEVTVNKNPAIFKIFETARNYNLISRILESYTPDTIESICYSFSKLCTLGDSSLAENVIELDRDSPFQRDDFIMPKSTGSVEFRNRNCIEVFRMFLSRTDVHPVVRLTLFKQLQDLIQSNPINYFIISTTSNIFFELVENIDRLDSELQDICNSILYHISVTLQYVPFKEISILMVHLHGKSSPKTVMKICQLFLDLVENAPAWKNIFRELGLLSTISDMVRSISQPDQKSLFTIDESIKSNFIQLMTLYSNLICSDVGLQIFREQSLDDYFALLCTPDYQEGISHLLKNLINQSPEKLDATPEFVGILRFVQKTDSLKSKTTLFSILGDFLSHSSSLQYKFKTMNGYKILQQSLNCKTACEVAEVQGFLTQWFLLMFSSISNSKENASKASELDYHFNPLLSENTIELIFTGCIAICLENADIVQSLTRNQITPMDYFATPFTSDAIIQNTILISSIFSILPDIPKYQIPILEILYNLTFTNKLNQIQICSSNILEKAISWICKLNEPLDFEVKSENRVTNLLVSFVKKISTHGMSESALRVAVSNILSGELVSTFKSKKSKSKTVSIGNIQNSVPICDSVKGFLLDLILHSLKNSKMPNYFLFDHSISSTKGKIIFKDYERSFPPQTGYTFATWIKIEKFDKETSIDIISIADQYNVEKLKISIDKDKLLCIKTAKSNNVFQSVKFSERAWTHLVVAHHKPIISASSVEIYLNGILVTQEKCSYLGHPGTIGAVTTYIGYSILADESNSNIFNLGPTYMIEENVLDAQTIAIIYDIGFEYVGNWQGSWATYLVGNSKLQSKSHKLIDEESHSPIFSQLASFALSPTKITSSHLLSIPEEKILFSLHAHNSFSNLSRYTQNELLESGLGKKIIEFNQKVVVNGFHPKPSLKADLKCALGYIEGPVIPVCPKRLVEEVWTLGGCAILLKLIEDSVSSEELHRTLNILVECVSGSWRNLAEMERAKMYEVLSFILKSKKELLSIAHLDVIMNLVGRSLENSQDAIINNPSALRHLVLDIDLWRTSVDVQKYYLNQLSDLIIHSSNKEKNISTLNRMAIIKRFLIMLNSQIISITLLPDLMQYLKIFTKYAWSAETVKVLGTFILNTLPKDDDYSELQRAQTLGKSLPKVVRSYEEKDASKSYVLTIRNLVINMFLEITADTSDGIRYGEDIISGLSSRWISYLLSPRLNPSTVVSSLRLFYQMWITCDSPTSKFKEALVILNKLLQNRYYLIELYVPLWAIFFQTEMNGDWAINYDVPDLMAKFNPKSFRNVKFCSEILPAIMGLTNTAIRNILKSYNTMDKENPEHDDQMHRIEDLSIVAQTTLRFIMHMCQQFDQMKECICKQEVLSPLVAILFELIVADSPVSLDQEKKASQQFKDAFVLFKPPLDQQHNPMILKLENSSKLQKKADSAFNLVPESDLKNSKVRSRSKFTLTLNAEDDHSIANECEAIKENISGILEVIMCISVDSILNSKSITGLESILKTVPSSSYSSRIHFQEFLLLCSMDYVNMRIQHRSTLLQDPKILANLGKFVTLLVDSVYQGMFIQAFNVLDFNITICQLLLGNEEEQKRQDANMAVLNKQLNRMILYIFGKCALSNYTDFDMVNILLLKIQFYQKLILSMPNTDFEFIKLLLLHLFQCLCSTSEEIQVMSSSIWKYLLLHKPTQVFAALKSIRGLEYKEIVEGFSKLLEPELTLFTAWLKEKNEELKLQFGEISKTWDDYQVAEARTALDGIGLLQKQREHALKKLLKKTDSDKHVYIRYLEKSKASINEVFKTESEKKLKFRTDYSLMQTSIEFEWKSMLEQLGREKAIMGQEHDDSTRWKLDFTEAKARIRKKMRRNQDVFVAYQSKAEKINSQLAEYTQELQLPKAELPPLTIMEDTDPDFINLNSSSAVSDIYSTDGELDADEEEDASPKSIELVEKDEGKPKELLSSESLGNTVKEGEEDDWENVTMEETQNGKIQRLLQPGDHIIEIFNGARLIGLELIEGIILICKQYIYIVDNYYKQDDGEIVEIDDVPQEQRNIYHMMIIEPVRKKGEVQVSDRHRTHDCRECLYGDIKEIHKRLYLFRNVALEMFLTDGRTFFLTFWNNKARDSIYNRLIGKIQLNQTESVAGVTNAATSSVLPTALFGGGSPLNELTQKWINRDISNLAYLMHLNTLAGRSYNDLTQYPVFPWVLADYESEEIDLETSSSYRDFSLPMGGQSAPRAEQFAERFAIWDDSIPACHYGTHYSSSMIVCSFLIRMEPFTQQYLKLQGGHFDHPDRIFHSIPQSWLSASKLNTTDVRELIPEFFYLPQFLENLNNFNFGVKQTGDRIDNVILPKWAKNNPRMFIKIHRKALESEFVSNNLHKWIDLIFGYKQQGEEAAKSLNVFHYLSYEGAVDIDKIEDPIEKQATISIIHNFGQTPRQLFKKPHPARGNDPSDQLYKIDRNYSALIQSAAPLKEMNGYSPSDIKLYSGQLQATGPSKVFIPPTYNRYIEWGNSDYSIRVLSNDSPKPIIVFESLHVGQITHAVFVDQDTLVTGGEDTTVCVWSYINGKKPTMELAACLRGHKSKICTIAVSRSFSIIVSGAEDNTAIIWELNHHQYIQSLIGHSSPIRILSINENTGDIISCDGRVCKLWDVNGALVLSKCISFETSESPLGDKVLSCIPFEGKASENFDTDLIFSGHESGKIMIWKKEFVAGEWCLNLVHQLNYTNPVNYLYFPPSARMLISGDIQGLIYGWLLPDGSGTDIHFNISDSCYSCSSKFAVLGRKSNCKCCGGSLCSQCITSMDKNWRVCNKCSSKLNSLSQEGKVMPARLDSFFI
ncbi:hypothetical protein HDV06_006064 [Boothiomyces sp. JEL0866]|nr:hypothetical protein HDV06_006014 [Boothiomyces sp. JEL0866]KAJ3324806.1 hypothetical protein HDV06_006064 [Boothiomyces sp. JEL0866]